VVLLGDRPDEQVRDEADDQQRDHDEQRRPVGGRALDAGVALAVDDAVDDERPGHTGSRPRGEQPAVDGTDLEGAEHVLEVGRDGREAAAVEGQDHRRQRDEQQHAGAAGRGQEEEGDAPTPR
jgi:hypothetical protein